MRFRFLVVSFLLVVCSGHPLRAQFSAPHPISTNVLLDTTAMASADIDSDGHPDVVIGTRVEGDLKWLRNDGSGVFTLGRSLQSAVAVLHLEAADFDGDGDQDVLMVSAAAPTQAQVFKNIDGTGFFDPLPVQSPLGGLVHRVEVRDVDGDGDQDLVLIQRTLQRVVWIANTGNGTFSGTQLLFSGADYSAMVWGDINGNGSADLVVAAGTVLTWRSCVNATCGTVQALSSTQTPVVDLFLSDADGDGDRDLFTANTGQVSLLLNTAGVLGPRTQIVPDGASEGGRNTVVLDADGDARADIFTVRGPTSIESGSFLRQWTRQGMEYKLQHTMNLPMGVPARIRAAQIIAGGRPELLVVNRYRGEVSWLGEPQQPFALSNQPNTFHLSVRSAAPYVFDMDMDGDLDHVYGVVDGILAYRKDGTSWTGPLTLISGLASLNSLVVLSHGDVDGDGAPEMLVFNNAGPYVMLLRRNLSGEWKLMQQVPGDRQSAVLTDMDGDGDLDLVAPTITTSCSWYRNQGGDLSTVAQTFQLPSGGFSAMVVADLDGDNAKDIIANTGTAVVWKRNNGDGSFPSTNTTLTSGTAFDVVDFDGDGDRDVVVLAPNFGWMRNDGGGAFTLQSMTISADYRMCADLDGDGDQDIAGLSSFSFQLFKNNGAGVLTGQSSISIANGHILARRSSDVDGNGTADVLVTLATSPTVFSYLPGTGGGAFTAPVAGPYLRSPGVTSFVVTDVDEDGSKDILMTMAVNNGSQADGVGWFRDVGATWAGPTIIDNASGTANTYQLLDIDVDGRTDILFKHSSGEVRWRRALAAGPGFAAATALVGVTNVGTYVSADFNNDGVGDLLAISSPNVTRYTGTGAGSYAGGQVLCSTCSATNGAFAKLSDIDDDGDLDIGLSPSDRWLRNDGAGNFAPIAFTHGLVLSHTYGHDVDHDGNADVVASSSQGGARWSSINAAGGGTSWLPIRGVDGGVFTDLSGDGVDEVIQNNGLWVEDSVGWYSRRMDLAVGLRAEWQVDIDSDGQDEFIIVGNGLNLQWYERSPQLYAPVVHPVHDPMSIQTATAKPLLMDSDDDGIEDLFVSGFRTMKRYAGLGGGMFDDGVTMYRQPEGSWTLEACDFDGDAYPDLLPVFQQELSVLVNQEGAGWDAINLWGPYIPWQGGGPNYADMADMDGNGTEDLVFLELPNGGIAARRIQYRPNLGGAFGAQQTLYIAGTQTIGLQALADMDGDGDQDILFSQSNRIMYIANLGLGFFGATPDTLVTLTSVNAIIPSDLDGDGAIDLLVHQVNGTNWLKNLGGWQMAAPQLIRAGAVTPMNVTDMDFDGDDDILFIGTSAIDIARNNGAGTFAIEPLVAGGARSCRVHDVDGDGDLDLMCTGTGSIGVYWYENLEGAPTRILGRVFMDANTNGSYQTGETGVVGAAVQDLAEGAVAYTLADGRYVLPLAQGTHTIVIPDSASFIGSTTGGWSKNVVLTTAAPVALGRDFGIDPGPPADTLVADVLLTTGLPRCQQTSTFTLIARNRGTVQLSGTLTLTLDPNVDPGSFSPAPNTSAGNTLTWSLTNLAPGAIVNFQGSIEMPASGSVTHSAQLMATSPVDPIPVAFQNSVTTPIICSFDPNSKRVAPEGEGPLGDIPLITERLTYTIDFQNLGNDTAFTVQLRDHLSTALDETSIRIIGSSHTITGMHVESDRELVITFADIELPDSTTDPLASMGQVTFSIGIVPGTPAGTIITNEAAIYFDRNAPVITNEVVSRLIDGYVAVRIRAFLGGAYLSTPQRMRDDLRRDGLLPAAEPYSADGYMLQPGTESGDGTVWNRAGSDAVIDWVVVELRRSGAPAQIEALRAGLVLADGRIVGVDGRWPLVITADPGSYHVAVVHRNHLGAMTSTTRSLSSIATTVDFTLPGTSTYGTNAQNAVGARRVLWPGDGNADGVVKYTGVANDRDLVLGAIGGIIPTNTMPDVYDALDINMNGTISYTGVDNDRDVILQAVGGVVPTAVRTQQLP